MRARVKRYARGNMNNGCVTSYRYVPATTRPKLGP